MKISSTLVWTSLCCSILAVGAGGCDPEPRASGSAERGGEGLIEDSPWLVSIQRAEDGQHICSGSILDDQWILTAAHCVGGLSAESLQVVAGVQLLSETEISGQLHVVQDLAVFPDYVAPHSGKDIALLRLATAMDLSGERASAIQLASSTDLEVTMPGTVVTETGWGTLSTGDTSDALLAGAVMLLVSEEVSETHGIQVGEDQLATESIDATLGHCWGDDGSPLTVDSSGEPMLVGVVSWGSSCVEPEHPRVGSRVSSFSDWIDTQMNPPPPIPAAESCADRCGKRATGSECRCDVRCAEEGNCCEDYQLQCG